MAEISLNRREYRSGRAAAIADAYPSNRGRVGLIVEMVSAFRQRVILGIGSGFAAS